MEQWFIDIRDGGFASLFCGGKEYRREPGDGSGPRWSKHIGEDRHPAGESRRRLLEWIYEHPWAAKRVRRFPRLPNREPSLPVKDYFDIPLTSSLPNQNIQWLVEGLIPASELILITGLPASFKSFFVEALAAAVSEGRSFLERTTKQTAVLLLDRDNPLHIITERLKTFNISEGGRFRVWGNWVADGPPIIGDPRLEELARKHRLLIIFDSFVRFHTGDENSAKEMSAIMAGLRKLVTAGSTVIVLHHSPKQNSKPNQNQKQKPGYRGSSDIHAGVDAAFSLSVDRKTSPPELTLECFKQRAIEECTITMRPDLDNGRFEVISDSTVQESSKVIETLIALIQEKPGLCQEEVIKQSKLHGERRISKILNDGEGHHWRVERPRGKTKAYFPLRHS